METITEDYVSLEISKLLKGKGFNEPCLYNYWDDNNLMMSASGLPTTNDSYIGNRCSAPTLQMAMKWLREKHKLHCDIGYDDLDWCWNIISVSNNIPVEDRPKLLKDGFAGIATYEEALEAAIKYCLENLI